MLSRFEYLSLVLRRQKTNILHLSDKSLRSTPTSYLLLNLTSIFDYLSCCCLHIDPKFYVANTSEDDQVLSVDGDDIILEAKEENKDIQLWIQGTVYMLGQ